MANIRKSFNFRNGVQVDDDNFIVNSNGLVGIGTSIPTELLDVVGGKVRITGLLTANNLYAETSTIKSLTVNNGITANGIVTAASFSGSASGLTNIYAIAVDGWYISSGSGTISTFFKVGIGTTNPENQFQIGNNPFVSGSKGAVIDINGNFYSSGNFYAGGISTSVDSTVTGLLTTKDFKVTGIATIGIASIGIASIGIASIGIATIGIATIANLTVTNTITGTANAALSLSGTPNINVGSITATSIGIPSKLTIDNNGNANYSGIVTATSFVGSLTGTATTASTILKNANVEVGVATVNSGLYINTIVGIGTSSVDTNTSLHIRKNSIARLQVTSDTSESIIAIGRSVNVTGNNAAIRHGNTNGLFPYSDSRSLDILNYDLGNVNYYLQAAGSSGINTGSFYWHHKPNFNRLMTLTYDGNLGIGITNPIHKLNVQGISTFNGNAYFTQNVTIQADLTILGSLAISNLTSNLIGNVYAASGISTFNDLLTNTLNVTTGIGINTDNNGSFGLNARVDANFEGIGIGTDNLRCLVDFGSANEVSEFNAFILPPILTNTERAGLSTVIGAVIYNSTDNRLQLYQGPSGTWVDL